MYNYYSSLWNDNHRHFQDFIHHDHFVKNAIVTNFFQQIINEMEKTTPNYDYLLFLEDDVAFYKNFFVKLYKEMNKQYQNELLIKLAYIDYYKIPETHWKLPRNGCPWGFWGMLYNKQQLRQWKVFGLYQTYSLTGDLYHCEMYKTYNQTIRMIEISYHFGRDEYIRRRDQKFWNLK